MTKTARPDGSPMIDTAANYALDRLAAAALMYEQLGILTDHLYRLGGRLQYDNPESRALRDALDVISSQILKIHTRATSEALALGALSADEDVRRAVLEATLGRYEAATSDSFRLYQPDGMYPSSHLSAVSDAWKKELSGRLHQALAVFPTSQPDETE